MATPLQRIARWRNWRKLRIMGAWSAFSWYLSREAITLLEKTRFDDINRIVQRILDDWDVNTKEILERRRNELKK